MIIILRKKWEEDIDQCIEEVNKPAEDMKVENLGKRISKHYVDKVVSTEDEMVEVKFAKRIPSSNFQLLHGLMKKIVLYQETISF